MSTWLSGVGRGRKSENVDRFYIMPMILVASKTTELILDDNITLTLKLGHLGGNRRGVKK